MLKPYIVMNTQLRQNAKIIILRKIFFKLRNNAVFRKTMPDGRKPRNIKPVTTERRINYLVSKPNYHTRKFLPKLY